MNSYAPHDRRKKREYGNRNFSTRKEKQKKNCKFATSFPPGSHWREFDLPPSYVCVALRRHGRVICKCFMRTKFMILISIRYSRYFNLYDMVTYAVAFTRAMYIVRMYELDCAEIHCKILKKNGLGEKKEQNPHNWKFRLWLSWPSTRRLPGPSGGGEKVDDANFSASIEV